MYRTAYVELNGTHRILGLSSGSGDSKFSYKNIDFFPRAVIPTLIQVLNMDYERVIIDFGIINANTLKEFLRCDVRLAVCTHSKWNTGASENIISFFKTNHITEGSEYKLLVNLVEKKKTISNRHFKYPVVYFPFLEDPFLIGTSLFGTLEKISERNKYHDEK